MKITNEQVPQLRRFVAASNHALKLLKKQRCLCGNPHCQHNRDLDRHESRTRYANSLVESAVNYRQTKTVLFDPTRRDEIQEVLDVGKHRDSFASLLRDRLGLSGRPEVAAECEGYLETASLYDRVLREILDHAEPRLATVTTVPGGSSADPNNLGRSPVDVMREQLAAATKAFTAGATEVVFREGATIERGRDDPQAVSITFPPGQKVEPLEPVGRMVAKRLATLLDRIACDRSLFPNLRWDAHPLKGQPGGFLVGPKWDGFDADSNEPCTLSGAKFYVSRHAADNEVVQAALRSLIAAAEHEVRENFKFDGVAIYRPHQPLAALWDFTKSTPPEAREEVPAK